MNHIRDMLTNLKREPSLEEPECETTDLYKKMEKLSEHYQQDQESKTYNTKKGKFFLNRRNQIDRIMDKPFIINFLIQRFDYKSYLEIGCRDNTTFNRVKIERKVGVDPHKGGTIRKTSDEFFAANDELFDVIFIDGLHLDYQVLKDIDNSLQCLSPNGTIVVHDCKPIKQDECTDNIESSKSGCWNGTVWRAIIEAKKRTDIDVRVLDCDWGLGIIRAKENVRPLKLEKQYSEIGWDDYVENFEEWIDPINFGAFYCWLAPSELSDGTGSSTPPRPLAPRP